MKTLFPLATALSALPLADTLYVQDRGRNWHRAESVAKAMRRIGG